MHALLGATLVSLPPGVARLVTPSQWVAAPWRNGGGITHEIAREGPPDAFAWRVSVADVGQAGPFSPFPGVDRVIALVEGDGFALEGDGLRATLRSAGETFAFPGDVPIMCSLLGGPVRDLNVMVDRARWEVVAERIVRGPGTHAVEVGGALLLLFVLDGATDVAGLGRAERHTLIVSERDLALSARRPLDLIAARLYRPSRSRSR